MSGLASFLNAFLAPNGKENYEYNDSIANVKEHAAPPADPAPTNPRDLSAKKWKEERNDNLSHYMTKRMLDDVEEESDDDSEDYIVPDNDEANVPYWNEGQEDSQPTTTANNNAVVPVRRKKVPHVDDTVHIAKTLGALDLYAREFHLSLGLVEHVWPLRAVPRREWKISSHFEDDGPLGTLFKQVVSLEVTALLPDQTVANMAQAAYPQGRTPQRLLIFFYNKYATQVSQFLERQHAERVLISLENIPAKCILPLDQEEFSWLDHAADGLAHYCLCIGSRSSMKLDQDGVKNKIAFDAPDLKVTIARVSKNDKDVVDEVDVTPDSVKQELELKETDSLEAAYQEWLKNQKEEAEKEQEEQEQASDADAGTTRRADTVNDGRSKKKARTEDTYRTLSELRGLYEGRKGGGDLMVNVFATVLGFSSPSLTKGYDWVINVTLVDESLPLPKMGDDANDDPVAAVTCMIFCRNRDALPKFRKAGEVVRIHRVAVQEWKGDIQLLGRKASSFVIVRPENAASTSPQDAWEIVPAAGQDTTFDQSDRERAMTLWKWGQTRLADYPTVHKASEKLTISDLARQDQQANATEDDFGDLTLMVSAILPVPLALRATGTPLGWLRVWDGTGPPEVDALPVASADAAEVIKRGDPPPEALQSIASAIEYIKSQDDGDAASSLEPPTCLCGRVTNLAVWEETHWDLVMDTLKVGAFIRLRNGHQGTVGQGLRCLMVTARSALTPLPNDTYEIKELLENHQKRVARKDPYNPQSGVLPLDGEAAAVAGPVEPDDDGAMELDDDTPMDVVQDGLASIARCISEAAPGSFNVKFHITGTVPRAVEGHHKLRCLCSNRATGSGVTYQFAVNMNDETAAIDALVSNEVGEALFQLDAEAAAGISTQEASAIMKDVTSEDKLWKGHIKSFELNGSRYFILDSVSAVSD